MIGMEGEERMEFSIMPSSQWVIIKNPLIFIKTSEEIVIGMGDRAGDGSAYRDIGT